MRLQQKKKTTMLNRDSRWLDLETNERKNLALWIMLAGAMIFLIYAVVGLWLVASIPLYVFWLAVIAHIQVFSIIAGFIAQLVKRRISFSRDGVSITDRQAGDTETPCEGNH